jgi:hypothetical protein
LHHESEGDLPLRVPLPAHSEYAPIAAFLADPRVAEAAQRWGVSFNNRSAEARTGATVKEVCSHYQAHARGPGLDCQQYSGNEPNGWCVNTCNSRGKFSFGCADISERDENSPSGFYTALFQCCGGANFDLLAAEKACVPQLGGETPCGLRRPAWLRRLLERPQPLELRRLLRGSRR